MKKLATLLMAFITISTLTFATPGDKLSNHSLVNAFLPNQFAGRVHLAANTQDKLNTINDLNTTKQKLDSAVSYGEPFEEGIKVDAKMTFSYNQIGQVTKGTMKIYNTGTSNLVYNFSTDYEYDQKGNMISSIQKITNGINITKTDYTYNDNGTLATEAELYWDDATSSWAVSGRYEYTYNSNKLLITTLNYGYTMSSEIGLIGKDEYTYDNNQKLTECTRYSWNEDWLKTGVDKYAYRNNNLDKITAWTVEFDDNGNELLIFSNEIAYKYDGFNNRYMETDYIKNPGSDELVTTDKDVYSYNNDYSSNDLVLPFTPSDADMKDFFSHQVVSNMSYAYDSGTLTDSSKSIYYYSNFEGSSVFDNKLSSAQVSPNPSTEYITFNWVGSELTLDIIIYDLTGQELINETVTKGEPVYVADLRSGVYMYKFKTAGKTLYGGKIVIM
ncbi:MAG: T9SS type A sorting domain-containing protein [bacterium]